MKPKNSFIIGTAALLILAHSSLAQDGETRRSQPNPYGAQPPDPPSTASAPRGGSGFMAYDDRTGETVVRSQDGKKVAIARSGGPGPLPARVLIIPKKDTDAKDVGEAEEDLNVMAHILEKAANDGNPDKNPRAMGIFVTTKPGFAASPNLYIEGYGAIFFLNVNFPLLPPPEKAEAVDNRDKSTSNEWEQARRELEESPRSRVGKGSADLFLAVAGAYDSRFEPWANPMPEYNADRVEDLQKDVITALKNAGHIRKLEGTETVTVVVTGGPAYLREVQVGPDRGAAPGDSPELGKLFRSDKDRVQRVGSPPRLIFRVRKSDAEAFQKNNLSFDEFRKKVDVILPVQPRPVAR